jgi:hypothetical protein
VVVVSLAPVLPGALETRPLTTSLAACEIDLFEALREFLVSCISWFFWRIPEAQWRVKKCKTDNQPQPRGDKFKK